MKGNGGGRTRKTKRGPEVLSLRITVDGIGPPVWREVLAHSDTTLHELHCAFQVLFQWEDRHLYEFIVKDERYEEPSDESEGSSSYEATLERFALTRGDRFTYVYDFGDDWRHTVEVTSVKPFTEADWVPAVVGGERAGPPEDCGGPAGFTELMRALKSARHPDHKALREWVGDDYDPERFDKRTTTRYLRLAASWAVIANGIDQPPQRGSASAAGALRITWVFRCAALRAAGPP